MVLRRHFDALAIRAEHEAVIAAADIVAFQRRFAERKMAVRTAPVEHHRLADPWESQVGAWLSREWGELKVKGALLTTHVVLTKALGLTPRDMTDATTKRASRVLRSLGFVSKQMRLNAAQASRFHSLTGVERDRVQVWVAPEQGEELATGEETRDADDYPN